MKQLAGWAFCLVLFASAASAQVEVSLPDYSQSTTASIVIGDEGEQAQLSLPSGVSFYVTRIGDSTASSAVSIAATGISLASSTAQLKVSLKANAAAFSPPALGATTWAPADVSWNAASWSSAIGTAGALSSDSFVQVATCSENVTACSTSSLVFTLAPKTSVKRSGNHTLTVIWKIESIGS